MPTLFKMLFYVFLRSIAYFPVDQGNRVAVNHADTVGLVQKRPHRTKRLTT